MPVINTNFGNKNRQIWMEKWPNFRRIFPRFLIENKDGCSHIFLGHTRTVPDSRNTTTITCVGGCTPDPRYWIIVDMRLVIIVDIRFSDQSGYKDV